MKILALDTSTEYCSAAVWHDARVYERVEHAGQRHSELLIGMIHAVLTEADVRIEALDAVAPTIGPGSFTGVRIATAVAQGLAFGAQVPVIGIGTLEAMAIACDAERAVIASDARMGEVYCAAYQRVADDLQPIFGPCLANPALVPTLISGGFVGGGNGFVRYGDALMRCWGAQISRIVQVEFASARHVAALAASRVARGLVISPESLVPVYVRDKVALTMAER